MCDNMVLDAKKKGIRYVHLKFSLISEMWKTCTVFLKWHIM